MHKIYHIIFFFFCTLLSVTGQEITGEVFDGNLSEPLPFANVVLLRSNDSSFVVGTATENDGRFSLQVNDDSEYLLKISFIGYRTQILPVNDINIGTINLFPDTQNLSEITVTASRPVIKMEKRGISIDIQNGVLKEMGTVSDVLEKLPFVNKDKTNITVFGKGTPIIFINNRQVRDLLELESINSNVIKKVTVITNPGAEYSSTVKSVIKIETLKAAGEGLSGNLMLGLIKRRKFSNNAIINVNYRKSRLDIFGLMYYYKGKDMQNIDWIQSIMSKDKTVSVEEFNKRYANLQSLRFNVGTNYVFNENHSMGMRYEYGHYPKNNSVFNSSLSAFINNEETDKLESLRNRDNERIRHYVNTYYTGQITPWMSMKLDVDFINNEELNYQQVVNTADNTKENILTESIQKSDLFASKLVFSTPIAKDNLTYGGEFARTNNNQFFSVLQEGQSQNLESNNNVAKQNLFAMFIAYNKDIGRFTIETGVRYEHVAFDYFVNYEKQKEQSRIFNDWFPNFNFSYSGENIQFMAGYSKSISRPSYYQLRNNIEYNSRYAYEAGNPFLKPTINNSFSSSIKWRSFLISANYDLYKDIILLVSEPYTEEILISRTQNFKNFKNLSASALYTSTIGVWNQSIELSFNKNIFTYGVKEKSYNEPIYRVRFRNNFSLSHNLQLGCDLIYSTNGHSEIDYVYNTFRVNVYLSKTFLENKLRINLRADDILGTDRYKSLREINNTLLYVLNDLGRRGLSFSLTYNFNTTKSKYKGEQASDEINRF